MTYLTSEKVPLISIILVGCQFVYIAACTFTMLLPTHKLFWLANLISVFPQIGTILLCALSMRNESDLKTDCMPIFMYV